MDKKIKKMVLADCSVLIALMVILWIVMVFATLIVAAISPTFSIKLFVLLSAAAVVLFSSLTLMAVLVHLKKNRSKLYKEELQYSVEAHANKLNHIKRG